MAFQQILDDLIASVPEALAATFTDRDGEQVVTRTIQVPNEALQLLGAYQQTVRRHLAAAVEEFDRGEVEQIAFATPAHWILLMGCHEGCTLVLVMAREGLLGRARFHMQSAVKRLNDEL
ncbi:MAG: hypothetical protein JST24_01130 [Acidobacteria bacterium]|nr:hypothetical protein [Acidobacteriota bacterium]